MTSYFDVSDAEGLWLGPADDDDDDREEVECIHGYDLFAHCDECAAVKGWSDETTAVDDRDVVALFDAADGGEENDDMTIADDNPIGFGSPIESYSPLQLVSMRNCIDTELKRRRDSLAKELAATEHAINGTKPRATRSDAGKPRSPKPANEAPPARLEHGELNPEAVNHAVRSATERVLREKGVAV